MSSDDMWEIHDNLSRAAQSFILAHQRLKKHHKAGNQEKLGKAIAEHTLKLYALKEALELTPGEFEHDEIDMCTKVMDGEADLMEIWKNTQKKEQMEHILNTAMHVNEDGEELTQKEMMSERVITVTYRDEEGQVYLVSRPSDDEEDG